jgi:MFS family permease
VILALLGFAGGFFIVPVAALLQHRPAAANRGGVLAASNLLSFVGIFLASGVDYLLVSLVGMHTPGIFLACAVFAAISSVFILRERPSVIAQYARKLCSPTSPAAQPQAR